MPYGAAKTQMHSSMYGNGNLQPNFLQHSPQHTITCAGTPSYRGPNLILTGADLSSIMPLKR